MPRLHAIWGPPRARETAWPSTISAGCPYAGDELLYDPAPLADLESHGTPPFPDAATHAAQDRAFHEAYVGILEGRLPWSAVDSPAEALQIDTPTTLDRRWPKPAWTPLPDGEIADQGEDWIPDMGQLAPPRVLGPFSDHALPMPVRRVAFAVMAFSPLLAPRIRPLVRGMRNKPKPSNDRRQAITAVIMAPAMAWTQDAGGRLRAHIPVGPHFELEAPVAGAGAAPAWIGRAVPTRDGPTWLAAALPLPGLPPADILTRRIRLELLRLRRHERRLSQEDLLRDRAEVLYRTACEWWYEHDPDAVLALWSDPSAWPSWPWPPVP